MNARSRSFWALLWIALLLSCAPGCSGLRNSRPPLDVLSSEGITDKRKQRNEEVVRQFESKRDFAEFEAARARWLRDDSKGCEELLKNLLTRNPTNRDALLLLGEVYLTTNRSQQAFEQVQKALEAYPEDAHTHYSMGLLLDATGQSGPALDYYERACQREPDNELYSISFRDALEAANAASGSAGGRDVPSGSAPPPMPESAALVPDPSPVRFASHAEPKSGAGSAGIAAAADTDPANSMMREGCRALSERSPQEARVCFLAAMSARPDSPQIPTSAAVAALRCNQPALAVELLQAAKRRFPDSMAVHRVLGAAYYRLGDYRSSQVALQQALSLDKSSALTYFLMGCTLAKLGQAEASEAHLRQARTLDARFTVRR